MTKNQHRTYRKRTEEAPDWSTSSSWGEAREAMGSERHHERGAGCGPGGLGWRRRGLRTPSLPPRPTTHTGVSAGKKKKKKGGGTEERNRLGPEGAPPKPPRPGAATPLELPCWLRPAPTLPYPDSIPIPRPARPRAASRAQPSAATSRHARGEASVQQRLIFLDI